MKKEIIENYIYKLTKDDIVNYLSKECIPASEEEINTLYNLIKNNYNDILETDFMKYISNYEEIFNRDLYLKIIEKYNKYKSLLE